MATRPWLESRQSAGAAYSPKIMDFYADKAVAAMVERFEPEALADGLARFLHLYKTSPIPDNTGGMGFWHGFALFTFLEILRPKAVVESGVYRGFSTWLIETLAPEARILSIDPALGQRLYISQSKNVTYSNIDFRYQDFLEFEGFDRSDVLVLFDDHNNHMDRLSHMLYHGFTQAIFDDNYYPSGDCLGMKKIIHGGAYNPHAVFGAFDNTANRMLMRETFVSIGQRQGVRAAVRKTVRLYGVPRPLSRRRRAVRSGSADVQRRRGARLQDPAAGAAGSYCRHGLRLSDLCQSEHPIRDPIQTRGAKGSGRTSPARPSRPHKGLSLASRPVDARNPPALQALQRC